MGPKFIKESHQCIYLTPATTATAASPRHFVNVEKELKDVVTTVDEVTTDERINVPRLQG